MRRIVLVRWVDSVSADGWTLKGHLRTDLAECVTVGMVIAESDTSITVSSTIADDGGESEAYLGDVTIPKGAISSTIELCGAGSE